MSRLVLILCCFFMIIAASPAKGQVVIDLESVASQPLPLLLIPIESQGGSPTISDDLTASLRNYIDLAGYFRLIDKAAMLNEAKDEGYAAKEIDFDQYNIISAKLLVKGFVKSRRRGGRITGRLYAYDVAARRSVVELSISVSANEIGDKAKQFVNKLLEYLTGEPGIFDTRIAFISDRTGKKELYVMNMDGTGLRQITNFQSIVLSPSWSPDGEAMAFVGYPRRGKAGTPQLYTVSADSQKIKRLPRVKSNVVSPQWMEDGRHFAVTLSPQGDPEIFRFNANSGKIVRLTFSHGIDVSPSVSPDGNQMVFASERSGPGRPQIYVKDMKPRAKAKRLTFAGKYNTSPDWSRRGNRIAYVGQTDDRRFNIFATRPDGRSVMQLTINEGSNEHPTWSPDGRQLVFASNRSGKYHIYTMSADGKNIKQLTRGNHNNKMPVWSPRRKKAGIFGR